ncbi:hypothetical protein [Legionella yabuuchiae]|uniref:hypothetical protein n=1 Tax=Legionella yabuuchiae TaxID=376727 RepID=UPI0010551108|nr:hypothetical protein [Legionella yabuuchiae]
MSPAVGATLLSALSPLLYFAYVGAINVMAGFGAGLALASCVFLPLAALAMGVGLAAWLIADYYAPEPTLEFSSQNHKCLYHGLFLQAYLGEEDSLDRISQFEQLLIDDYQSQHKEEIEFVLQLFDPSFAQGVYEVVTEPSAQQMSM